MNKKLIYQNC